MRAAVVEHRSPTRGWRGHAESEKAHSGFGEDGSGHANRRLHNHRLNNIWQNVADDDAQIAGAQGAGGFDKFALARGQYLASNQAGIADPSSEGERENKIKDAGAAEGYECNRKQNSRE